MPENQETTQITIKDVDITKFSKLDKGSYGNFTAYGSNNYKFYLPKSTELELTNDEEKWLKFKPAMGNINRSISISDETKKEIEAMSDPVLKSNLKRYRCDEDDLPYIIETLSLLEKKLETQTINEIGKFDQDYYFRLWASSFDDFLYKYFGLTALEYKEMLKIEDKTVRFNENLKQVNGRNEAALTKLLKNIRINEKLGCDQDIYEGMKWLSNTENIQIIEQNENRLSQESEIARASRLSLRKKTSNLASF
jgi:hypothetical protein